MLWLERAEPAAAVSPDLFGITWAWYFCDGYNATVEAAYRALSVGSGRFPGGTGASFWDWDSGTLLNATSIRDYLHEEDVPGNCSTVHDCTPSCACDARRQPLCEAARPPLSAERIWKGLYGPAGVRSMVWQPNLFFDVAAAGAPRLVELGNEHYLDTYTLLMRDADAYVERAAPVAAAVQAAGGRVGLTAEPSAAFDDAATAAHQLAPDPRRRDWNMNMSRAVAARGVAADAWVLHSYKLSGLALEGSNHSADWGSAAMLWAEASLLNARDHVTRLAGASTEIWLTEYGASAPCMPWPDCPIGSGPQHERSAWMRDAVYSPVHAFGLIGHLVHALANPAARITAAHLHAMFADFSTARGVLGILPAAAPDGSDLLNVSVLAQTYSHVFAVASAATAVRPLGARGGARLANFTVGGRSNFSAIAGVAFVRGGAAASLAEAGAEDLVLLNRATEPVDVQIEPSPRGGTGGTSFRVSSYASDAPTRAAGFATIGLAPPPLPWPAPMPVAISTVARSEPSSPLQLTLAPLSLTIAEELPT